MHAKLKWLFVAASAHLLAQATANFLGYALGNAHGSHTARLRTANAPARGVARLSQVLRHLRGLAAARLADHHQHLRRRPLQRHGERAKPYSLSNIYT